MTKHFTLWAAMLIAFCYTANAQTKFVTFQVSNPANTPVYVFGSWNSWSNFPGFPMTMVAPGKYSVTVPVGINGTHEFLFVNDSAGVPLKEMLSPSFPCTNGNAQFTNRVFSIANNDTSFCYTWATCNTCTVTPPPPPPVLRNVTLQVSSPDSTPVHVQGSWNWANFPGTPMTMIAPGKYSATLQLAPNTTFEYKFNNGVTPVFEGLTPNMPCTNGNAQYTNRVINIANSDTTVCNLWASCLDCNTPPPPAFVNVTLQVFSPDSTPVHVQGSWNWGIFPGAPMTMIAPNKYSATIQLPPNTPYEYKFNNGVAPTFETLMPTMPCTNGNAQYTNRTLGLGGADTTICSTWSSCANCNVVPPASINVKFAVQAPDSLPVHIFGNWNGWNNFPGEPMTFNAATNSYEKVVSLLAGATIEYLYVSGTQNKETLMPNMPCTNGNPQYTNRIKTLGTVDMTMCTIWESCAVCLGVGTNNLNASNVSVQVAMDFIKVASDNDQTIDAINIYDVMGRLVFAKTGNLATNTKIPVQLSPNSLYMVQVISGGSTYKVKSVVR